jgi:hypothetical protein
MTAPKTYVSWGFGAKVETTYGTINAVTASDGILLKEVPVPDVPKWLNMGDRGVTPAAGVRQNAPNSGRWGEYKVVAEGIGSPATQAYAAGVKPQLDVAILSAGFLGTGSFTAGQEFWQYTPVSQPSALTSVTTEVNVSGQLYRLFGAYSDLTITAKGPMIPDWVFDFIGMMDLMTDATIPTFTSYPNMAAVPMKADNVGAVIGLWTGSNLIVRDFELKMNRDHKHNRANMNAGGHAGYTPAYRRPELTIQVERVALATVSPWNTATTLNPYKLCEDAVPVKLQLDIGAVQYKRWHIYTGNGVTTGNPNPTAQAVLKDVKDSRDGPTATWTLIFELFASTYGAADEISILYN